jgi:hypothetical protein
MDALHEVLKEAEYPDFLLFQVLMAKVANFLALLLCECV